MTPTVSPKPTQWLIASGKAPNGVSPLGETVAHILDRVWGIHNTPVSTNGDANWDDEYHIVILLAWHSLSTVDYNNLTALVVLCHDHAVRLDVSAKAHMHLQLMFHQRQRDGNLSQICPTIEEHISRIRR